MEYDIRLERDESGPWTGVCDSVNAVTQANTARGALAHLRGAIALAVDADEADVEYGAIEVRLPEAQGASTLLAEVRSSRTELAGLETKTRALTREAVRVFTEAGLPRRDVGEILGLSGQRVTQLLQGTDPAVA